MRKVVDKEDKEYPELLGKIKGAPKKLYYKGKYDSSIFDNCLAVVGSRHLTNYGKRIIERDVAEIAANGITIVSGFMYGGDAAAHEAALRVGGKTIAIMPCGIDRISPEYQKELYQEILDNNGLIISEYKGDMQPALWTYPQRNRIVAGLSKAVLVIEAGIKSGSLITADCAKKFNRKVFAAPGPIFSKVSEGANQLIREGAEMFVGSRCVLEYYSLAREPDASQKVQSARLDEIEKQVIQELEREELGIDELSRKLGISSSELGTKLSMMQIKGIILQRGGRYCINE